MSFAEFFHTATGNKPYNYQCRLACGDDTDPAKPETLAGGTNCASRLISIPTGLGKTAAVTLAWLWNRIMLANDEWPRRLVYCLPMRTLVEQTRDEIKRWLDALVKEYPDNHDLQWLASHSPVILMGGEENDAARREWDIYPEKPAILIGTQDMLLSRALNRGYGMSRARWPMHFALLNNDALWVMDEAQLMDVGLSTSAQLQSFRADEWTQTPRPACTWWMSATLQSNWLKSPETGDLVETLNSNILTTFDIDKKGPFWSNVQKTLEFQDALDEKKFVLFTLEICSCAQTTLIIVNTVKRASAIFDALLKNKQLSQSADVYLAHSRFRPADRKPWRETFLSKDAPIIRPRIIVATQVVEAGVDISADVLITELAPWTSLVQRFGRAARYGGSAKVVVVDVEEKKAAPYDYAELEAAHAELKNLVDVAIPSLEAHEAKLSLDRKNALYPYAPDFLLLRHELDELFDTSADLSGADLDIARFIRSGEENDCQVAWIQLNKDDAPPTDYQPCREELCAVSIGDARKFTKDKKGMVWKWDYLDKTWVRVNDREVYPGVVLLARADAGGYDTKRGFDLTIKQAVPCLTTSAPTSLATIADAAADDESLSEAQAWQSIAEHGQHAAKFLNNLHLVPVRLVSILDLAARWHDIGKAHPAFVSLLKSEKIPPDGEVAKAPENAWIKPPKYKISNSDPRPGFRHELASTLALFDLLKQYAPKHEALLGPWSDFLCDEQAAPSELAGKKSPIQQHLARLSADDFNLLLYLIASHHGKVRCSMQASPADQKHPVAKAGDNMPIRGILEGDTIPAIHLALPDGTFVPIPATTLTLEAAAIGLSPTIGASWSDRCATLLEQHGPFALAWLETLIRAADARASQ